MFHLAREVGKIWRCSFLEKGNFTWLVNSDMVKPEKSDDLHLVYHFTLPLKSHKLAIWIRDALNKLNFDIYDTYVSFYSKMKSHSLL